MARKAKYNVQAEQKKLTNKKRKKTALIAACSVLCAAIIATVLILALHKEKKKGDYDDLFSAIDGLFKIKSLEFSVPPFDEDPNSGEKYVLCISGDGDTSGYYLSKTSHYDSYITGKYNDTFFTFSEEKGGKTNNNVLKSVISDLILKGVAKNGIKNVDIEKVIEGNAYLSANVDKAKAKECFDNLIEKIKDPEWRTEFLCLQIQYKEDNKDSVYYLFKRFNVKKLCGELYDIFSPCFTNEYEKAVIKEAYENKFDGSELAQFMFQTESGKLIDFSFDYTYDAFDEKEKVSYPKTVFYEYALSFENGKLDAILYETDAKQGSYDVDSVNNVEFDKAMIESVLEKCEQK